MDASLYILTDGIETNLLFKDIKDKSFFEGTFDNEEYTVKLNETIFIKRRVKNSTTIVNINKKGDSNIEIINENGSFLFKIKVVEIIENNGMISLVYMIDDKESKLRIKFF